MAGSLSLRTPECNNALPHRRKLCASPSNPPANPAGDRHPPQDRFRIQPPTRSEVTSTPHPELHGCNRTDYDGGSYIFQLLPQSIAEVGINPFGPAVPLTFDDLPRPQSTGRSGRGKMIGPAEMLDHQFMSAKSRHKMGGTVQANDLHVGQRPQSLAKGFDRSFLRRPQPEECIPTPPAQELPLLGLAHRIPKTDSPGSEPLDIDSHGSPRNRCRRPFGLVGQRPIPSLIGNRGPIAVLTPPLERCATNRRALTPGVSSPCSLLFHALPGS